MSNRELSEHLSLISQVTDLIGGGHFRVTAFRNAAEAVRDAAEPVTEANMSKLPRVGKSCKEVIIDFLQTGTSNRLTKLAEENPGVVDGMTMCSVKGIGPKTAMTLVDAGIPNLDALVTAVESGALDAFPKLLRFKDAILIAKERKAGRLDYDLARAIADFVLAEVQAIPGVTQVEVCGSLRRKKATVKDADFIVKADLKDHPGVHEAFRALGSTFVSGDVKTTIYVEKYGTTFQCDLWTVEPWYFGGAVCYATGSKDHNIKLRMLAKSRRMRIDEKGIFGFTDEVPPSGTKYEAREDGLWLKGRIVADRLGGENERDLYDVLGIDYVEPEDREKA